VPSHEISEAGREAVYSVEKQSPSTLTGPLNKITERYRYR